MERSSFLEKIVPGLRDYRTIRELREGFGENPPKEAQQEISKLSRRLWLKVLATKTIAGTAGISWILHKRHQGEKIIEANASLMKAIHNLFRLEALYKLNAEEEITEDGKLRTINPKNIDESGLIIGFSSGPKKITLPNDEDPIEFEIDRDSTYMQPYEGETPRGEIFPLGKNIRVKEEYLRKNKVEKFRINMMVSWKYKGESHKVNYEMDYITNLLPIETEEMLDEEIRGKVLLSDPKIMFSAHSKLQSIVDKHGTKINNPESIKKDISLKMGKGTVFLGDPLVTEGMIGEWQFEIMPDIRIEFFNEKENLISKSSFPGSILFSKEHLETQGVKKIVIYLNYNLTMPGMKCSRSIKYEYGPEDYAEFEMSMSMEMPTGAMLTLKP